MDFRQLYKHLRWQRHIIFNDEFTRSEEGELSCSALEAC